MQFIIHENSKDIRQHWADLLFWVVVYTKVNFLLFFFNHIIHKRYQKVNSQLKSSHYEKVKQVLFHNLSGASFASQFIKNKKIARNKYSTLLKKQNKPTKWWRSPFRWNAFRRTGFKGECHFDINTYYFICLILLLEALSYLQLSFIKMQFNFNLLFF